MQCKLVLDALPVIKSAKVFANTVLHIQGAGAMKIISCLAFAGIVFSSVAYADERDGSYQLPLNGVQAAPRVLLAQAAAKSAAPNVQVELDALIRAAKSESGLTIYSGATENVAKRVGDAFSAKYGIKVQFSRMAAAALMQRFSAEAEANSFAADLLFFAGGAQAYAEEGGKKGWIDSIAEAGIPAMKSGEYPARFSRGASAIVQIAPWMVAYNTEKLKGTDVPRDWPDLLKPHLKGQILLPNPASALAYLDFWVLALEKYGPEFFAQLRAQNPRQYASGVPAVQALGAGEGMIELPAVPAQVEATRDKGAPLATSVIDLTSGVEMQVMLTARGKSKNPNAARLMTHFIMTKEGNTIFNDDPGGMTVYDTSKLPKQYVAPKLGTAARAAEIAKLLGF